MKNTVQIIAAVVIIAVVSYLGYITYQDNIRRKELDKKLSDNLDDAKDINKLIKEKLDSNELSLSINDGGKYQFVKQPSKNGKAKTKSDAKKEVVPK